MPMMEANPSWTVVSLEQVLAAEIQETWHDLWEGVSLKAKTRSEIFFEMGQ